MSLAARVLKAKAAPVPTTSSAIVPLDLITDVLGIHPVVGHLSNVEKVHTALLALHSYYETRSGAGNDVVHSSEDTKDKRRVCEVCKKGHEILDPHEGCLLCDQCGAVFTLRPINITPEYMSPVEEEDIRRRGKTVPGVPSWMLRHDIDGSTKRGVSLMDDLEHWNHFTNHSVDTLEFMKGTLLAWSDGGHTHGARLAAVLLYPLVRKQMVDANDVRKRIRRGDALHVMDDFVPEEKFPCGTCGVRFHTAKDARFHCRVGFGKKKRRL